MKRLTDWDKGNPYCIKCFEDDGCDYMETDECDTCEHHIAIYRKLAEYEDTGLEPSEIADLNHIAELEKNQPVHCKDCVHYIKIKKFDNECGITGGCVGDDDYCSNGECNSRSCPPL